MSCRLMLGTQKEGTCLRARANTARTRLSRSTRPVGAIPRGRQPWPERYVAGRTSRSGVASQFRTHLADAKDEGPLQAFLARHPILLRGLLPAARDISCFDRPRFGAQVVPDFLLCPRNSA